MKEGAMCYQETVKKVIFAHIPSKRRRMRLIEKGLDEIDEKIGIYGQKADLNQKQCSNGGLIDRLPSWVTSH